MTPAVSVRARLAGRRCLLLLALAIASLPAAAQSMACGTYRQDDGHATLHIESEGHGFLASAHSADQELRLARDAQVLGMVNLASGRMQNLTFGDGDRRLGGDYHDFALEQPASCKPLHAVPEGSCRADPVACMDSLRTAKPAQLRQWCSEDVPVACERLVERYQDQAKKARRDAARGDEHPEAAPAFCDPASGSYDDAACQALARVVLAEEMTKSMFGLDRAPPAPLPAAQLVEVMDLCRQYPRKDFCQTVANVQWDAGRLLEARQALQHACSARADAPACGKLAPLIGLPADALTPATASVLPCGTYLAEHGAPSTLRFGDAGVVTVSGYGNRLRARVQDGLIRVRGDVGDALVLQPLRDGSLAGVDSKARFARYVRQPGAVNACSASRVFKEMPLPLDCPALGRDGGAAACCKAGQLLGCKLAAIALTEERQWDHAMPHLVTLCTAGVREGCLGLAGLYEHTADPVVPRTLAAICAQDGSGTHTACDVDATRNWPAMRAQAEQQQATR